MIDYHQFISTISRRYLRRSLVLAFVLPILLLSFLLIYYKHSTLFSERSSYSKISNRNQQYRYHFKNVSVNTFPTVQSSLSNRINSTSSSMFRFIQKSSSSDRYRRILPVITAKNLSRFVHLDLKGAAPKVDYYEKLFPFLKQLGADGLLIEYEDMFPFTGHLQILRHDFAYSKNDIKRILKLAKDNNLQVMPLLQVYGHLEYVLKLKEFKHLREDQRYPQVITPCLEESYKLLFGKKNNVDKSYRITI